MPSPCRSAYRLVVATLAFCPVAYAQTNNPSSTDPAKEDEPVTLSAFNVSAAAQHGYIASESVTGTRVATKIADLPFAVSVVTNEFMRDFDMYDLTTGMSYIASLNSVDTQGNYNLRGFNGINSLRNGFYRLGLEDEVDVDRIEVIKGPNAAIYGSTTPSGIINIVTKQPTAKPYETFSYTHGSLRMDRANLNINQTLGSFAGVKLLNLLSVNWQDNHEEATFGFQRNRLIDDNLLAKLPDGSTLDFEFQWSKRKEQYGSNKIPFLFVAKTYLPIQRRDLGHFSQGGPDVVQNREIDSYNLTWEKRWSDVWSSRVGGYAYFRHAFNFNNGTSDQYDPTANTIARGTPLVDPLNEDGAALQADTTASYTLFHGAVKNKSLITFDYSQNWRYRKQSTFDSTVFPINPVNVDNPNYGLPARSAFSIVTRNDKTRWDTKGVFLRQQSTMFNDHLILFIGLRRDLVTYNLNLGTQYNSSGKAVGSIKTPGVVEHYESSANSPNFGANYKLTSHWALYASASKSFLGNAQNSKLNPLNVPIKNEIDKGLDYGVKGTYFDERLNLTAGGYYINRYDVSINVTDPATGLSESVNGGNQNAKGVEFEASWNLNADLVMLGSYSYVNAKIVRSGSATDVGQPPPNIPADQASFAFKYSFTGTLKGLALNGGVIYIGSAYPNSTATDIRRNIDSPGYATIQMGLSYEWKTAASITQSIRLSSTNLFNRDYVTPKMLSGDSRRVYVSYSITH